MSSTIVVEPFTLRGTVVRYRRLPSNWIEVLTFSHDSKFRAKLRKSAENSAGIDEIEETKGGNLRCHVLPTKLLSYNKLISTLLTKFIAKIERYEHQLERLFRQEQHTRDAESSEHGYDYGALAAA
ncbi:MAG TPA: hypothetical protein VN554_02145 [Verrucomicrobiae bacterium]|nr:hypothetical protein [Verrucomicrobiae bacterium]